MIVTFLHVIQSRSLVKAAMENKFSDMKETFVLLQYICAYSACLVLYLMTMRVVKIA